MMKATCYLWRMKRKTFGHMQCPVARSLERVGDWWNILILRDAFYGIRRFDEFQQSLGIASSTLSRRLDDLVASGLLEKRLYNERPPRHEYVLTQAGRDFRPVLLAMVGWGNRNFAPEGASVLIADSETGETVDPVLVDRATGRELSSIRPIAGPAADALTRKRMDGRRAPLPQVLEF